MEYFDKSIEIESIMNQVEISLVKVESIIGYVAPIQVVVERLEVG